jgi:short-subunit dehydrogenase
MPSMSKRWLIIGATSAIAHALARRQAAAGARLALVARNERRLHDNAADLRARGAAELACWTLDLLDTARHGAILDEAFARWGGFDVVLVAHGQLPDQAACERSVDAALTAFDVNARSTLALATLLAQHLEAQRSGTMALIASPAGERGRRSNYVYGAAKAAVIALASGLRHRLHASGVRVLTIQPGFVATPMTEGVPGQGGLLWSKPDRVAADIERAIERGNGVTYCPGYWRWILAAVRALPERLFVRTGL